MNSNRSAMSMVYKHATSTTSTSQDFAFRIGVGKNQKIVTRISNRSLSPGSNTNRETVTVVEAISGDGFVLPPMVIVSGIIHQERWFTTTGIEDDFLIAVSDTGYSNDNHTQPRTAQTPRLVHNKMTNCKMAIPST